MIIAQKDHVLNVIVFIPDTAGYYTNTVTENRLPVIASQPELSYLFNYFIE